MYVFELCVTASLQASLKVSFNRQPRVDAGKIEVINDGPILCILFLEFHTLVVQHYAVFMQINT